MCRAMLIMASIMLTGIHGADPPVKSESARHEAWQRLAECDSQVKMALKVRGARDDITVLVVDVLPGPDDRVPPLLRAHAQRGTAAASVAPHETPESLEVLEPLTAAEPSRWLGKLWCVRSRLGSGSRAAGSDGRSVRELMRVWVGSRVQTAVRSGSMTACLVTAH